MEDCLFCSIANGDESKLIWSNDAAAAFKDIHPKAPVHVLVVPKRHVQHLDALSDEQLAGQLMMAAREVAKLLDIQDAYRFHINNGHGAGQVIDHLHIHLLGGFKADTIAGLRGEGL